MKFSVIIPNLNSPVIDQTVAALEKQSYDKTEYEGIIVGQDDLGLIKVSPLIRFDRTERPYAPAEARNRGAKQASGEVYVFLDADCIPSENWLATLEHILRNPDIHGVSGGVKMALGNYWAVSDNFAVFHDFLINHHPRYVRQGPSLNLAIRQNVFWQIQGFDEKYPFPAGEDFDLTYRMSLKGYKLFFEPKAWVMHKPPRNTLRGLWIHGYKQGLYSTKVNPSYAQQIGFPRLIRGKWQLRLLAPFLAVGVSLLIFVKTPRSIHYFYTLPAVFISRLAWCLGAANSPLLSKP